MKKTMIVQAEDNGRRIDVVLAEKLGGSRNSWQKLFASASVAVGGSIVKQNYLLRAGDELTVELPKEETATVHTAPDIPILYEDDELLVLDKPAGISVHAGVGTGATVADFTRGRVRDDDDLRPGIVHRLDKDTSGLLVVAKTAAAKAYMQELFRRHEVAKTYVALLRGRIKPDAAVIRLPIGRDEANPLRRKIKPSGKAAETAYTTLTNYDGASLVEAKPASGRTHQLRVHFSALGHPVVGDVIYGDKRRPKGLGRQFLHASSLRFVGPSGQKLELESPLPPDLERYLDSLQV